MTCACWDGPFSSTDPTLVSVRCDDHADVPPAEGHRRMDVGPAIAAAVAAAADNLKALEHRYGGKLPQRAPSVEVCVEACGSKCCRTPGMAVFVRTVELRRLQTRADELGVQRPPVHHEGNPNGKSLWRYEFASTGNRCVFLDDRGLCRVYDDRPNACRVFPHRPVAGCLVWPDPDATEGGVIPAASA